MPQHRSPLVLATLALVAMGCSKGDTPKGAGEVAAIGATADTGNALGATPAAGGMAAVTPADAKAVTTATEYKLTEDNFGKFVAATDSLAALRKRDPKAAAFLAQEISDHGRGTQVSTNNAGRKRLEDNPAVANAIAAAGLSVRDYFVASIAIAQAERFMGNPKAAPPTPTLGPNAAFLNTHKAQLAHLKSVSAG
jgi:hypothetical protein